MEVVLVSNILNHHQIPFCEAMIDRCDSFHFVETSTEESFGYQKKSDADYVVSYSERREKAEELILKADTVIFGSSPNSLIQMRMSTNKLSFIYSERLLKNGLKYRFDPRFIRNTYRKYLRYKKRNLYVLCAGAYLSYDLKLMGFPVSKCFKWGYFPRDKEEHPQLLFEKRIEDKQASILWAGRLIGLKHPDASIRLAKKLKENNFSFKLNIIGEGEMRSSLSLMIKQFHLEDTVTMLGEMSTEDVREEMEKSDIFLFTSDRHEGWGAVLNEAMNSCCAVVANDSVGSVPFLIRNGENGYMYETEQELFSITAQLIKDKIKRKVLGENAYYTIRNVWNAEEAASRLLQLVERIETNSDLNIFNDGPCSMAKVLKG